MESQHKYKRGAIALCCILLVFSFIVTNSHSTQEEKEEERLRNKKKNPSEWKLLLSSPTISNYWEAIKNKYLAMAPSYYASSFLSPPPKPNTDFRGKVDKEEGGAIGKSIEKAKETIEESAKSAAKMATDKLSTHPQDEL